MTEMIQVESATGEQLHALAELAFAAVQANSTWPELDDTMEAPEMSKLLRDAHQARVQALKALHEALPAELVLAMVTELRYRRGELTHAEAADETAGN